MNLLSHQYHRSPALLTLSAIALVLLPASPSIRAPGSSNAERKADAHADPFEWDHIENIAGPRAFWWWPGSSAGKPEIDRQLQSLKSAGNPGRCENCVPGEDPFSKAAKARGAKIKESK